jgi:hypothetical protein
MRLTSIVALSLVVCLTTPALAAAPAAPQNRGIVRRIGGAIGGFIKRQLTTRLEVKEQLRDIKGLRKSGELEEAAAGIADAPRPQGLVERFRLWRAKKQVLKEARKAVKGESRVADRGEAMKAFTLLDAVGKMSRIDQSRAGNAMLSAKKNGIRNAEKLAERGQAMEAIEAFELGRKSGKMSLIKEAKLRIRLHHAAMRQAKEMGELYASLPEGHPEKEAVFDRAIELMEAANKVGSSQQMDLSSAIPGRMRRMVGGSVVRTQDVLESMGMSGEEIGAKIESRAEAQQQELLKMLAEQQKSEQKAKDPQLNLFDDAPEKSPAGAPAAP